MQKNKILKETVYELHDLIYDNDFKLRGKAESRFFTRKSKLGFPTTVLITLNFLSKPLFCELNNYFKNVIKEKDSVEQQSFSEARQKVNYTVFQEIFERTVKNGISADDCELYKNYRLLGIDGSTIQLPNSPELKQLFGKSTPIIGDNFARISGVFDILNNIVIDAELSCFDIGERELAMRGMERICKYELGKCLVLMDRGYWKKELYAQIIENGNSFLARIPNDVTNEIKSGAKKIVIKSGMNVHELRCYRFSLSSGETETLITNLTEEEVSDKELSELYFLRWGVETKYDELKNILKLEPITSKTYLTVMQDFYATMTLSNLVAFAGYIAEEKIKKMNKGKNNKYIYKQNRNVIVASLKDNMVAAIASPTLNARQRNLNIIEKTISKRPVPIRPDRSCNRPPKSTRRKTKSKLSVL